MVVKEDAEIGSYAERYETKSHGVCDVNTLKI